VANNTAVGGPDLGVLLSARHPRVDEDAREEEQHALVDGLVPGAQREAEASELAGGHPEHTGLLQAVEVLVGESTPVLGLKAFFPDFGDDVLRHVRMQHRIRC
jgi:hypothetical protein